VPAELPDAARVGHERAIEPLGNGWLRDRWSTSGDERKIHPFASEPNAQLILGGVSKDA
jgi:hypothetical protein